MVDPNNFKDLVSEYTGAIIKTNKGNVEVKFYNTESPFTVNNFLNLADLGFYDETKFHRVIPDFMIQGGDPLTKEEDSMYYGTGGPGYRFNDEFNNKKLVKGSLAMANSGPNTNGSQFFIVTAESTPWLDGAHTNFGQVVSGMEVVNEIDGVKTGAKDVPEEDVVINSIELVK
ncbi:MAG: peptidylprolyl isomerase [Patescibacteria group bacterium]|jgi:cyclophilin family peptidyl-prolyl cis-trans isomerase|nr:peptidylprolyl isomerase [Patescibacteria group bacterium]